jgi:hypothetical protein
MKDSQNYGAKIPMPKGVAASDGTGSHGSAKNRIPNAMTNKIGADKKFDGGKTSGVAYVHDRKCYQD